MSFDKLAPHYRWMEIVLAGGKLQRCRTQLLDDVGDTREVLLVGEGHGRFLETICEQRPQSRITVLDESAAMLRVASRGIKGLAQSSSRVTFVHANVLDWRFDASRFDLIVTQFFLDCFTENQLACVVETLAATTTPCATWLLADFQIPHRGFLRARARVIHALMYAFFRSATRLPARRLSSPDRQLANHGFELVDRRTSEWGLLRSDRWKRAARNAS